MTGSEPLTVLVNSSGSMLPTVVSVSVLTLQRSVPTVNAARLSEGSKRHAEKAVRRDLMVDSPKHITDDYTHSTMD